MTFVTILDEKKHTASFRPDNHTLPKGFSQGFGFLPPALGTVYFNGGSLFPSPRFDTSTHSDCDNS